MAIVYHGKVDSLKRELDKAKPYLDKRYVEILGVERIQKLKETSERILTEESFFNSTEELNGRLKQNVPWNTSNKFILLHDGDVANTKDKFKPRKIKTAPAIYVSDIGTQNSAYKNILHSYVHEWNHFIWYALQRVPLYLADMMIDYTFGFQNSHSGYDKVAKVQNRAIAMLSEGTLSRQEAINIVTVASYSSVRHEHVENSNRLFDKMVLNSIGVDIELEWRYKDRRYAAMAVPSFGLAIPIGGDPYKNLSDQQVIDRVIDWENYHTLISQTDYIRRFMEMLRKTKVSRLSLKEIEKFGELKRED